MAKKKDTVSFEKSLSELENIVQRMEHGDLSLEESLAAFERGIMLTRECQASLREAEQKVSILTEQSAQAPLQAFDVPEQEEN